MIDAHFHIWRLARGDYGWLTPALGAIHRDVALADWRAASSPCGITGGVLVQAAPTEAESRFLLEQAGGADDVLGVVGWVDMAAADAPQRIGALARHPKLKALRPMLQDIDDPDWILDARLAPAFSALLEHGLAFDALVKPLHLPRIASVARRYPQLRIVLDHGAKPDIAAGQWQDWADAVARLAQCANVVCKLSGLWTEAAAAAPVSVVSPYLQQLADCFGWRRLMWGSDWPVLELAGDYRVWHQAAIGQVPAQHRAQVFDLLARAVYRL